MWTVTEIDISIGCEFGSFFFGLFTHDCTGRENKKCVIYECDIVSSLFLQAGAQFYFQSWSNQLSIGQPELSVTNYGRRNAIQKHENVNNHEVKHLCLHQVSGYIAIDVSSTCVDEWFFAVVCIVETKDENVLFDIDIGSSVWIPWQNRGHYCGNCYVNRRGIPPST